MISIAIDPGLAGAIVALALDDEGICCIYQRQSATMSDLNPDLMLVALREAEMCIRSHWATFGRSDGADIVAVLERVQSRPKQGLSSTFKFGHGRGLWRGLLAGRGWRVIEPTPAVWTRAVLADLPGEGKARSIARASQIRGLVLVPPGKRKPQDGLADACCLALYGLREGA